MAFHQDLELSLPMTGTLPSNTGNIDSRIIRGQTLKSMDGLYPLILLIKVIA